MSHAPILIGDFKLKKAFHETVAYAIRSTNIYGSWGGKL